MNRFLLTVFISLTALVGAKAQTRVCNIDFDNGIPDTLILKDYDGLTPKSGLGFPKNTAWTIWEDPNDAEDKVVCSCSYYENKGEANDWLVIPNIALPEDSAACQLFWRSRSAYDTYKDGYYVFITTDKLDSSTELQEYKWKYLRTVMPINNDAKWTSWQSDMSKYAGDTVNIAFVNYTTNGWLLFLDDITIGDRESVTKGKFTLKSDKYAINNAGKVAARLKVGILDTIASFTAQITTETDTITEMFGGLDLKPNEIYEFALETGLPGIATEVKDYKLNLLDNEEHCFASDSSSFTYLLNLTSGKKVVAESYINNFDGYCIRAYEGYNLLRDTPWFIGLQLHGAGVKKDPMTPENEKEYTTLLQDKYGMDDVCDVLIDRMAAGEVYDDIANLSNNRKEQFPLLESYIEGSSYYNSIEISTKTIFALNSEELKCNYMFVLTEDSVWNKQSNIYSGGYMGNFNGYQYLDDIIEIHFNDVVRKTYSADTLRFENTVAGDTINGNFKLALPTNIENHRMLRMTMIVTDSSNGEILNAARCSLEYKGEKDPTTSVIENICEENLAVTDEYVIYNAGTTAEVSVYTPCGKLSSFACGEGTITAALPKEKGLYIIVVRENELTLTKKVLRK